MDMNCRAGCRARGTFPAIVLRASRQRGNLGNKKPAGRAGFGGDFACIGILVIAVRPVKTSSERTHYPSNSSVVLGKISLRG